MLETTTVVTTPINDYISVREHKSSEQKDTLIVRLLTRSMIGAYHGLTGSDVCQSQMECVQDWCAASALTDAQHALVKQIMEIPEVLKVCVLTVAPVFDIYVIGNTDDPEIYDKISNCIVDYKYLNKMSAAYMYMTESEFSTCKIDGVTEIIPK